MLAVKFQFCQRFLPKDGRPTCGYRESGSLQPESLTDDSMVWPAEADGRAARVAYGVGRSLRLLERQENRGRQESKFSCRDGHVRPGDAVLIPLMSRTGRPIIM